MRGGEHPVFTRVGRHGEKLYFDLADARDTVIEIDTDGWRVCEAPPVRFRRVPGMRPLPMPETGSSIGDLRRFLNVPDDDAFALLVACLTAALRPEGPYPVLVLLGEQGSAKTTTARLGKNLLDPNVAPVRCEPREVRDLMIAARNAQLLVYDNISHLPPWLSDALCRLATGGGFGTRQLFTDDEETIFDAQRPVIVNGIEDFITRSDLLERSVLIRHPPIPESRRRPEAEVWREFDGAHPRLLGALLTRVAGGLRELPRIRLDEPPRMADFALFAVACEAGAGEKPRFLEAYKANQADAQELALEACVIVSVVVEFMAMRHEWVGSATELLGLLGRLAPDPVPRGWPQQPNALTNRLRRVAPSLRSVHELAINCDARAPDRRRGRLVRLTNLRNAPGKRVGFPPTLAAGPT